MYRNNRGFTIIEVMVSLVIIMIIGTMMVYAYSGSLRASRDLYFREQTKMTLLEYSDYCANHQSLPQIISGDNIWAEKHTDILNNIFNYGSNTRFVTFFGPIDTTSVTVNSFNGTSWVPVAATSTASGAITIPGLHKQVLVSYKILGWDYIKDRRFNYGNSIILSYIKPKVHFLVADDGTDIPVSDVNIFNSSEGRIIINTNKNKWINIYYQVPRGMSFKIIRPNVLNYTIENNTISFTNPVAGHYVLVNYKSKSSNMKSETKKVSSFNQAAVSENIISINSIKCLTIEAIAEWETGKYTRKISYITGVKSND